MTMPDEKTGCQNCQGRDAKKDIPKKYLTQSMCGVCYRKYQTLNWEGRQKYEEKTNTTAAEPVKKFGTASSLRVNHEHQRNKFAKDIVQPYTKGGYINRDFVKLYPDQAKKMFHPSELNKVHYGMKGNASRTNPKYDHESGV